jgi:hypothetical protein
LIDSSSKALIRQALESLHNQIKAAQAVPPQQQGAPSQPQPASAPAAPAPVPFELEAPSQTQFAFDVAKDVLDDLLPPEKRSTLIAIVLGILAIFLLTEWWINRLAHRVADILEQRR